MKKFEKNQFKRVNSFGDFFYFMILIGRNYLKSPALWITNFFVPIFIFFILKNVLTASVYGLSVGLAVSGVISVGVLTMGVTLTEWKNSIIYKKVKVSLLGEAQFFAGFFVFYFLVCLMNFWVTIGLTILIDGEQQSLPHGIENVSKWGELIIAICQLIFISLLFGIIVPMLTKDPSTVQGVCFGIYIISSFLISAFLPIRVVVESNFLRIWAWWTPFFSPMQAIWGIFLENNQPSSGEVFQLENLKIKNISGTFENMGFFTTLWQNILFSFAWIVLLFVTNVFLIKNYRKEV